MTTSLTQLLGQIQSVQGLTLACFAVFCAYWAQEHERNPWLWFFAGLFFGPLTGLVLLVRNAEWRRDVR